MSFRSFEAPPDPTGSCVVCYERSANSEYLDAGSGEVLQVCHACREGLEYEAKIAKQLLAGDNEARAALAGFALAETALP